MSCLCILEINPLSFASFANIFFHYEGCLFILLIVSFVVQKLLSLISSHLFIFVFIFITLGGGSKKILLQFMSKSVLPMFPSKSFRVMDVFFELIFLGGIFSSTFVTNIRIIRCYKHLQRYPHSFSCACTWKTTHSSLLSLSSSSDDTCIAHQRCELAW